MKHADWVTQYKRVFVGQSGEKLQELGPKHSDEQAASQFAQFIKLVDQSETLKDPDGIEITKDELKLKDRSTSADATYIRNQWTNQKSTSVALWDAYAKVVGNMKAMSCCQRLLHPWLHQVLCQGHHQHHHPRSLQPESSRIRLGSIQTHMKQPQNGGCLRTGQHGWPCGTLRSKM